MSERSSWQDLRGAFTAYARGRQTLLDAIGLGASNRDPLSEFSEQLIAALLEGELAKNRVQRGWDLRTPDGRKVQVKYLANPGGGETWINEIAIGFGTGPDDPDDFAVVFYEALLPASAIVFGRERLLEVCQRLRKRHPNQERTLQLTQVNYREILADRSGFALLGIQVFDLQALAEEAVEDAAEAGDVADELSKGGGE